MHLETCFSEYCLKLNFDLSPLNFFRCFSIIHLRICIHFSFLIFFLIDIFMEYLVTIRFLYNFKFLYRYPFCVLLKYFIV